MMLCNELDLRLRNALMECSEFDSDCALRAVFVTDELHAFRDGVPSARDRRERVSLCLDYLLPKRLSTGEAVLPIFVAALSNRYSNGDALQNDLTELIEPIRDALTSAPVSVLSKQDGPRNCITRNTYTFENRQEDIRKVVSLLRSGPYLHLYGPSGIGKTYLADYLLCVKYADHPSAYIDFGDSQFRLHCFSIEETLLEIQRQFDRIASPSAHPMGQDDLRLTLGTTIRSIGRFGIVVLDNFSCAAPSVRRELREDVLPALEEHIADPGVYIRFIVITQVEMKELDGVGRVSFEPHPLKAFRLSSMPDDIATYKSLIRQAIERWGGRSLPLDDPTADKLLRNWAYALHNLSGGHPGAIEGILNHIGRRTQFRRAEIFEDQKRSICESVLLPLVEQQIQFCLPSSRGHQLAFHQLWIFRSLSKSVFRQLIRQVQDRPEWQDLNNALCEADYDPIRPPFWESITKTHLLQTPELVRSLLTFQLTPIWRTMGNLVLQVSNPTLYQKFHHDARQVFDRFLSDDDIVMRIECFVESLYHLTQETPTPPSTLSRREFTQVVLDRLQRLITSLEGKDHLEAYLYDLSGSLENDQTLRNELNQIGQPDTWDQVIYTIKRWTG